MMNEDAQTILLNVMSANRVAVDDIVAEMHDLAGASSMLGLGRLAERLHNMADTLDAAERSVRRAHGDALYDVVRASEQASMNLLNGVMAGIKISEATK